MWTPTYYPSRRSLILAVVAGLGFGAYMALADTLVFRGAVPGSQAALVATSSVLQRIAFFARGAVIDELEFQLVLMTALVWLFIALARTVRGSCYWIAILSVAFIAYPLFHLAYLASLDFTALVVLREIALHGAAGVLWGYLYWRHGFVAAALGHVSAHIALEPLLGLP
jgi:hypothetical protein